MIMFQIVRPSGAVGGAISGVTATMATSDDGKTTFTAPLTSAVAALIKRTRAPDVLRITDATKQRWNATSITNDGTNAVITVARVSTNG